MLGWYFTACCPVTPCRFQKTIRYASRKAYAEVRPRIKGRFARKDEIADWARSGIVPEGVTY
jgi:hypothetical protein